MVGIPGRSRGCLACRQRKIKCDQALPACSQCRRSRRRYRCTGSITGVFISTMTSESVNQPTSAKELSRDSPSPSPLINAQFEAQSTLARTNDVGGLDRGQDILSNSQLEALQLPRAKAFEQLFISHFVESFGNTRDNPPFWLDKLPEFFFSSAAGPARESIRAATMLFYGILTCNIPIQTEANRFYARALRSLRAWLQNGNGTSSNGGYNTNASAALISDSMIVCAPVMMCHFEMMASSSPDGWMNHIEAAAGMLERLGPENCRLGLEHEIFLTVRLFMVFVCMTRNKAHLFMSEPWMTIPFEKSSKNLRDELVDVLLLLPACLIVSEEFLNIRRLGSTMVEIETKLRESVLSLVFALHQWRLKYCYAEDGFGRLYLNADACTGVPSYGLTTLVAVFDAANVIAFSLLLLVTPATYHANHSYQARLHAQLALSADAYIDSNYITAPGGGSLLMAFALKIVSVWAPLQEQRDYAIRKLQNWDLSKSTHESRGFAAPVFRDEVSNVYYVNVAKEISHRLEDPISWNNGPADGLW